MRILTSKSLKTIYVFNLVVNLIWEGDFEKLLGGAGNRRTPEGTLCTCVAFHKMYWVTNIYVKCFYLENGT